MTIFDSIRYPIPDNIFDISNKSDIWDSIPQDIINEYKIQWKRYYQSHINMDDKKELAIDLLRRIIKEHNT